jgi:hypothetical protein
MLVSTIMTAPAVWEQVGQVRGALSGRQWSLRLDDTTVLPGWFVDVVDGHMGDYVGPDPVLFRTAGISTTWFDVQREHPLQLEVTCAHRHTPAAVLEDAITRLAAAGGTVDTDAYVWGSGDPDSVISVRLHRIFATFDSPFLARAAVEEISWRFIVVPRSATSPTVELVPRLMLPGRVS